MNFVAIWFLGLAGLLITGFLTWLLSIKLRDVSIVDSLWALFFVIAGGIYLIATSVPTLRAGIVLMLVTLWGVRLATYITWRNWGEGEDRRYQAIRANREPGFEWRSLYIVFGLQALLAWIISLPLLGAIQSSMALGWLDLLAIVLVVTGIGIETTADLQLARFKANPANAGRVMDQGIWRYSRHPNYFGDCCVWWGFYGLALAGGAWWTLPAPLLMTWLLLKFSGVVMLEKDIGERRPAYADYINRTNAFIPGPVRESANFNKEQTTC